MGDSDVHTFGNILSCGVTIKEKIPDNDSQTIKEEIPGNDFQTSCSLSHSLCSVSQNEDSLLSLTSYSMIHQQEILQSIERLSSLKNVLSLNSEMQRVLRDEIPKVTLLYENNLKTQGMIKDLKEEKITRRFNEKAPNQMKTISLFAAPYFRDVKNMIPPFNEDTKIKRKNCDVNVYVKPPKPWTESENKNLLNGVTEFALQSALKPHNIKRNYLRNKLKDNDLLDFEIEVLQRQLEAVDKKIKTVKSNLPLHKLFEQLQGNIDWMQISSRNMEGKRLPEDCENMWNNVLSFTINKEAFCKEEDNKLLDLAEDNKERNWDLIADSLQTNRTAILCFERYQTHLSKNLKKKFWTPEEDKRLSDLVNKYKCGEIIPWNKVCMLMDGRTRQQCINRYDRSISQSYKCGPWTTEEDGLLIACYRKFGTHWAKMKNFFKRRSTYAIRERYCNALDPNLKTGFLWTFEEDMLLIQMIRQYGYGKWSRICKKVPGRTDNMCLNRATRLLEYSCQYLSNQGIEIDPGIYDPELYAKILKPIPQAKGVPYRMKVKPFREDAIRALLNVLEKVFPEVKIEAEDFNEVNFYWMTSENLYQVSEELHRIIFHKEMEKPPSRQPFTRYFTKPLLLRKREYDGESNEESIEECAPSPEKHLPDKEKEWLDSVLNTMFQMSGDIIKSKLKRILQAFSSREHAETSLYKAYFYKSFRCSAICDDDDNIENVTFSGIDFSETLQTVVSFFIQPPIYNKQFIAVAPNLTTLLGLEVAEVTENRLQSMSECVSYSQNYIDYIYERRGSCPKCMQCLSKVDELHPHTSAEFVISNMKNKHIFMNETMETSAYIESGSTEKCVEDCSCASLRESLKSVQLLRQRFMSLFLWPVILASLNNTSEQEDSLCTQNVRAINYFSNALQQTPRPKKFQAKPRKRIVSKTAPTVDSASPKVKTPPVACKRVYPEVLRRSKRLCVLRRTSFAYPKKASFA